MYVSRLCRLITLVNNELNGICSCLARRSTTSTNVGDGPPLSSELKSFSEVPGPGGLYRIPYIGAALFFKPFSEYSQTCLKGHLYIKKSLSIIVKPALKGTSLYTKSLSINCSLIFAINE